MIPLNDERIRSRHPFQLFMLIASFLYSLPGLAFTGIRPGSVQETVGPVGTIVWSIFLCLGTGAALLGIFGFRSDRATGLTLEGLGLLSAGSATAYYALIVVYANGPTALFSALVMVAFGAACIVRAVQLRNLLRAVRRKHGNPVGG